MFMLTQKAELRMASFAFLFLFFLAFLPCSSMANITLSTSLTTNDDPPWLSPSEDFAFGFWQLAGTNMFLLAIWFNKISQQTIVWHANGDNPVPRGSKVQLTESNLVLTDPKGLMIWEANPTTTVSSAAMLDTGNFVLAGTNSSTYVWESFRNPTDTILPGQTLNLDDMLSSRITETNYSEGRFVLNFSNGSLQLRPIAWPSRFQYPPYYNSDLNHSESGNRLLFNESAYLYIVRVNGEIAQLPGWTSVSTSIENYYYRATLDYNGVFTQYAHPKDPNRSQSWLPVQSIPENICVAIFNNLGSGPCGYNSYCSMQNSRPRCDCPPGYVLIDPQNSFGGCVPTFPQGCGQDDGSIAPEQVYEFSELNNVNWPLNDYERLEPYNQSQCQDSCLHDCSCAVAVFGGSICWKKRLPLSNGRTGDIGISTVLFKVRKEAPPNFSYSNSKSKKPTNLRSFTYKELVIATEGFKEELGRGSFGIVYKGVLKSDSRIVIAVKKIDKLAEEREREFRAEVSALGRTHHKNLVRLLGYCDEGSNRLLIMEFMSNGSLSSFIFTHPRPNWHHRVRIALGIARGLLYLHEECEAPIIHCDIKPQNMLLDDNLSARIADFGLAKLLLSGQSRTRTMMRGTKGYVAPEWFKNLPVTSKVDVYSYGVVLLEIICCRRNVVTDMEEEEIVILTDWAYDFYVARRMDVLVDNDELALSDKGRLERWLKVAFWCIQEDPLSRPTMKMVMEMLEGFVEVPSPNCPSSFG
ncbi:hypothetical protein K2173_002806 [Erythroxylum novogranatense]|uniref:Receptor-like serine/threonine-protein kinase n=1 Tax=Erythroxylum novogranatense TaxID=1862640 RepID=A0AAV8SQP8_9ROSI|nr:hypothetical protein K2173_002806 [Erythroxylum novogranatense]